MSISGKNQKNRLLLQSLFFCEKGKSPCRFPYKNNERGILKTSNAKEADAITGIIRQNSLIPSYFCRHLQKLIVLLNTFRIHSCRSSLALASRWNLGDVLVFLSPTLCLPMNIKIALCTSTAHSALSFTNSFYIQVIVVIK